MIKIPAVNGCRDLFAQMKEFFCGFAASCKKLSTI